MKKSIVGVMAMSVAAVLAADEITVPNAVAERNSKFAANQAVTGDGVNGAKLVALTGGALLKAAGGGINSEAVLVFKLPELPAGHTIANANLTVMSQRSYEPTWNVDVYGVRSSLSSSAVQLSDYGAYDDAASGTKLANNFLNPADQNATFRAKSTDDAADLVLANWIAAQYAEVGAGAYVFLRLQADSAAAINDTHAYNVAGALNVTHAVPQLTIITKAK